MSKSTAGFTLLEVLIALIIFSVAAAGLAGAMGQGLKQAHDLEQKTFATWVAENHLTELRMAHQWPNPGVDDATVEMAGQKWRVTTKISAITEADMSRIEVSAGAAGGGGEYPVVTLTGFAGRH